MSNSKKLVLLVSGWGGRDFLWGPYVDWFKRTGHDVVTANLPANGFGSITESACEIAILLEEARDFYEKIILVGHSMGGLINRVMIQHLDYTDIDAYVSIGTPHAGSVLGHIAPWSESARQMRPRSEFLKTLNAEPWPSNIPALGLQAQYEEIVWPRKNAKIRFGKNIIIPKTDHISILLSVEAFKKMYNWLTFEVFNESGLVESPGFASRFQSESLLGEGSL